MQVDSARLSDYMRSVGRGDSSYGDLWKWSVTEIEDFWSSIWTYFDVQASRPHTRVLSDRSMPGARWFEGAELSYAEHIFRDHRDDAVAIVHASETAPTRELTWGELRALTGAIRAGLIDHGVTRGDRVVAYMPNIPESVAAFLACASIGATWSSAAPEFGARSVADRFSQIEPKVLLAVDGYRYGGKAIDRRDAVAQMRDAIPSLEHTFVLDQLYAGGNWTELMAPPRLEFEQLPFDHPLWVLYSSGTTGPPKAIVHGQGGVLLEHLKALALHTDLRAGDRFFWFTTTSWMMWNFLVGGLLTDAAIVLYDGHPATPSLDALWDLASDVGITCFGTSAAFLGACMKAGLDLRTGRDLSRLRSIGSTGSPLAPEVFRWVYESVSPDTWLFSMSGGTDVCTAFVGGVPTLPVFEGELQARALGAKVEAFDEGGRSVVGEVGELVLTEPMPTMPLGLWGDTDDARYRETYFSTYPGVWRHGDWFEITSRGTAVIHGRSDSTINRSGVRIGTAEIYRALLSCESVLDALVIDIPHEGTDGRMHLFVVLKKGTGLSDTVSTELKARIRQDCSPRHVPDVIHAVDELPRTRSGKLLEVPVKRILMGWPIEQAAGGDSVANPQVLLQFLSFRIDPARDESVS